MLLLHKTLVAVAPPPRAHMLALLADLDADHDGKLDAAEFEAFVVWLTGGLLARAALQVRHTLELMLGSGGALPLVILPCA